MLSSQTVKKKKKSSQTVDMLPINLTSHIIDRVINIIDRVININIYMKEYNILLWYLLVVEDPSIKQNQVWIFG